MGAEGLVVAKRLSARQEERLRLPRAWVCACGFSTTWVPARARHEAACFTLNSQPSAAPNPPSAPPTPSPTVEREMEAAWSEHAASERQRRGMTEARVREIVRGEAARVTDAVVSARTRRLTQPYGILPIEGRLELRRHGTSVTAILDGSDIAQLLAATYSDGAHIRILILDLAALNGNTPQLPRYGQTTLVYNGIDPQRGKPTSLLDTIPEDP